MCIYIYLYLFMYFYLFSHLADVLSKATYKWGHYNRNQNQQKSNNMQVLYIKPLYIIF